MKKIIEAWSNILAKAEENSQKNTPPLERVAPGHKCDHPGCGIRFVSRRERLKHLLKDHHCEKCGWGHSLSYSFGNIVPDVFMKQHAFCKACTLTEGPLYLDQEYEGGIIGNGN